MPDDAQKPGLLGSLFPAPGPEAMGAAGERRAADFLRRERGYTIVARNWRNPADRREEIDLVVCDDGILVFVEVKSRTAAAQVAGFFAVDRRKKAALRRVIRAYLRSLRPKPRTFRFDIVEVEWAPDGSAAVRHFASVALFGRHFLP